MSIGSVLSSAGHFIEGLFGFGPNATAYAPSVAQTRAASPQPQPKPAPQPDPTAALRAQLDAANRNYAAVMAQIAAQPRIYSFNTTQARSTAQAQAQAQVNPYYQSQYQRLLDKRNTDIGRSNQDADIQRQRLDQALSDALQGSDITRQRTLEDVATKEGDINTGEQQFQQDEGAQFDQAYRALASQLGDLADTGAGRQQVRGAVNTRNVQSDRQEKQFTEQRQAVQTFKNRTFEDLARSDTQAQTATGQKKQDVQIDLDRALQDIEYNFGVARDQNELERQQAVYEAQDRIYGTLVDQFINSLAGRGARAQDIVATAQLYK